MRLEFELKVKMFYCLGKSWQLQSRQTQANKTQLKHETATEENTQRWASR